MRIRFFLKRAIADIWANRLLHALAMSTIGLIFLLAASFALIFVNLTEFINSWQENVRVMAYLSAEVTQNDLARIQQSLEKIDEITAVRFLPKQEALILLRDAMQRQADLLDDLDENPLPDAFELSIRPRFGTWDEIEGVAVMIERIKGIAEVDYGQAWLEKYSVFMNMTRMIALVLGTLLSVAAISVTANTIRLVLYNRRDEIAVMKLVGATDAFIRAPFYIQGMFQGIVSCTVAFLVLFIVFHATLSGIRPELLIGHFQPRFFSLGACCFSVIISLLVGCVGCYLSFRQFSGE